MNFSYWENTSWFSNIDFTIIGSGIVGLNCAISLKETYPKAKVLVLERGILPQGASTKNAGFACFGSLSEILDDLSCMKKIDVVNLVEKRHRGLKLLRKRLTDKAIAYKDYGGYELFAKNDKLFNACYSKLEEVNQLLHPIFKGNVFKVLQDKNKFQGINKNVIYNAFEGQIDTGKMMSALLKKAHLKGILVLNNIEVTKFIEGNDKVYVNTKVFKFSTSKLFIATNGFASKLINEQVKPARAQVLITKPIKNLHIKGAFHLDKGFYYFRNIDNRILLGGGRNLDFEQEETFKFGQTRLVEHKLKELLKTVILPNTAHEVDYFWSGIMGVGSSKKVVVKQVSNNVFCGVRLGGMGVSIGSLIGEELAKFA
ncbi:NAD(P)/FAD-dependent oxidoreductase [Mangrovimonas spongiae]|uniref:FAD-binding oxidoreductase n=1 Tax=Mangrovimonas spongiae TaxID=2494697 RepID=A0A3R9UWH0_9FLAO|nr:FAD-dependent oxidoreductase [Mangrovimonas spongiae]RSK41583.1 FAD-binding oxidoreductase [Mangrovimonas spongiae]